MRRFVKDRDGKGGKVVKLTGSLDAKNRYAMLYARLQILSAP